MGFNPLILISNSRLKVVVQCDSNNLQDSNKHYVFSFLTETSLDDESFENEKKIMSLQDKGDQTYFLGNLPFKFLGVPFYHSYEDVYNSNKIPSLVDKQCFQVLFCKTLIRTVANFVEKGYVPSTDAKKYLDLADKCLQAMMLHLAKFIQD